LIGGFDAEVIGSAGPGILLLPGGAATSRDFFPHLQGMPDFRTVLIDRPGTGRAVREGPATLRNGATACATVLRDSGCAPAIVVGQSLGGAVAIQLAVDHPDLVSGLVLIDPTPFNDPQVCRQARWLFEAMAFPTRIPGIGPKIDRAIWRALAGARVKVDDDLSRLALRTLTESATLADTARAVASLTYEGPVLTARLRTLDKPCVILTADRKPDHRVRRAHQQLADALGARIETWPGAIHAEHLRRPTEITALVNTVATEISRGD
jgi:pimeloyl-ACP methyl ester carboxylesterase